MLHLYDLSLVWIFMCKSFRTRSMKTFSHISHVLFSNLQIPFSTWSRNKLSIRNDFLHTLQENFLSICVLSWARSPGLLAHFMLHILHMISPSTSKLCSCTLCWFNRFGLINLLSQRSQGYSLICSRAFSAIFFMEALESCFSRSVLFMMLCSYGYKVTIKISFRCFAIFPLLLIKKFPFN